MTLGYVAFLAGLDSSAYDAFDAAHQGGADLQGDRQFDSPYLGSRSTMRSACRSRSHFGCLAKKGAHHIDYLSVTPRESGAQCLPLA
jgi:hypothetical protein